MRRRDFLKASSLAAISTLTCKSAPRPASPLADKAADRAAPTFSDPALRELADLALQAARDAGASYADIRIADYRRQSIATREARVTEIRDSEERGFGVRVIADGTWGFVASARIERDEVIAVARRAVAMAKLHARLQREPVRLAPVAAYQDIWNTPIERDPFAVPLDEKIDLLLAINAGALAVAGVDFCTSSMDFVREHKFFASTEGSYIEQTLHRCNPAFSVTSVDRKLGSFKTRNNYAPPKAAGYEYIAEHPWLDEVREAGEDAVAKHTAKGVEPGRYDLILHPSNLWLTIHESIGHPTELDRAMGLEANYAGTSFLTPDKMGTFQLGSEIVNFQGEKTRPGSLATCGYDDDGVQTSAWPMVQGGVFVDYQTTRDQAHLIGQDASHGTAYAQSWKDVAFQRMPNINLVPGPKPLSLNDLIGSTDRGILVKGRGSYSIDHQRYNFQFSGQTFWEIQGGKVVGMLEHVAYQASTPDFWRACDAVCSADEYWVGGTFRDGKGEPGQSNAVSHGCPPARFRQIDVLNTERDVG